jgi:hypothetical protein
MFHSSPLSRKINVGPSKLRMPIDGNQVHNAVKCPLPLTPSVEAPDAIRGTAFQLSSPLNLCFHSRMI